MATKKKLLEAAAGAAAGGTALNVEDVFSTYLYNGISKDQGIENGIALGDGVGGGTSTEFDGVNDFLSRSSDLTGNADGKTFTLSCWVYRTGEVTNRAIYPIQFGGYFLLEFGTGGQMELAGANTSGSTILSATLGANTIPLKIWTNVIISVDLANTSNRHVYINDVAYSPTWLTYSNQDIDFTRPASYINSNSVGSFGSARHAHIYLDYTYRDLSVTSNRRYFIDANGGSTSPSTLSALNPIIYLPMTNGYSIGQNLGTGGDYTVNGSPKIVQSGTEYLSGYGQGGMVWIKDRTNVRGHALFDTERGANIRLQSQSVNPETTGTTFLTSFLPNGFNLGTDQYVNGNTAEYVSWTFRKHPKFFDVQTITSNSYTQNVISHNLESDLGCAIFKQRNSTGQGYNWLVWHRSLGLQKYLRLNENNGQISDSNSIIAVDNTAKTITFGYPMSDIADRFAHGGSYSTTDWVGYFFAHNNGDGEFGATGDQDIIKCGSYIGNGGTQNINVGFEPQWVMIKRYDSGDSWYILDSMRGFVDDTTGDKVLVANNTDAESDLNSNWFGSQGPSLTATGFKTHAAAVNGSGSYYMYIAIRRPTGIPTSATDVFDIDTLGSGPPGFQLRNPVDMALRKVVNSTADWQNAARLTNGKFLKTNSSSGETTSSEYVFDYQNGWNSSSATDTNTYSWMWRRAPKFFDVLAYRGIGGFQILNHSLGVKPEAILIKQRGGTSNWIWWFDAFGDNQTFIRGNLTNATFNNTTYLNNTAPTDTQITLGYTADTNGNTSTSYIAYLFASLDGISKVGSYIGNGGPSQDIDCGFSNGARFVLVKAASGAGDWWLWDTTRGITSGNDANIRLNSTAAQVTALDFINPLSSGFTVVGSDTSRNGSGITYVYYAIA